MRFCFYSGYEDVKGGYTTLLLNLITELSRQGEDVVLINFTNGIIAKELNAGGIKFSLLDIQKDGWKKIGKNIKADDILILSKFHEAFYHLLNANPKVLYYNINDFISSISSYKFNLNFTRLGKKLVVKLLEKNSLFFMDDTGIENIHARFGINVDNPRFLPIPVPMSDHPNTFLSLTAKSNSVLQCSYIGRAVNWKIFPLQKILADILKNEVATRLTIITDNKRELFKKLDFIQYKREGLELKFLDNMTPSEIDRFLAKNSQLNFGMGTTALHSAALGIPTVLMDYANEPFPDNYAYTWLYESENFSLGKNISWRKFTGKLQMKNIMEVMSEKESMEIVSRKCFEYVSRYHDLNVVAGQLRKFVVESDFRLMDAKEFIPYYSAPHQFIKRLQKNLIKNGAR